MTPAITLLKQQKTAFNVHSYEHDPQATSYGMEAVEKLGLAANTVFKTLLVEIDKQELVVAVIPVAKQLSLKLLASVAQSKKAKMADPDQAQRSTGYLLGGISPLGQKKRLRTFIDQSAMEHVTIHVSAGRKGLEIELSPHSLQQLLNAQCVAITD